MRNPSRALWRWGAVWGALALGACETFEPAPSARLVGDANGTMQAPLSAPLLVQFSEPISESSLKLKVVDVSVPGSIDAEGDLLDEQTPPKLQQFRQSTLVAYDGARPRDATASYGASLSFDGTGSWLTISPAQPLQVSRSYMLLIEPGLESLTGHATVPRNRYPFSYQLKGGGKTRLPSGYYYFLLNVDFLAQQVRTYADFRIDPATGSWHALFTAAARVPALNSRPGCPASCPELTPICQLYDKSLPSCVKPSDKQTNVDQFRDFLPQTELPNGYTFPVTGFAKDSPDGTIAFGTAKFDVNIHLGSGNVALTAKDTVISGTFRESATEPGRFLGGGSISVALVQVNGSGSGPTKGTFTAMSLTQAEVDAINAFGTPVPTVSGP